MDTTKATAQPEHIRARRVGRKVLASGSVAQSIERRIGASVVPRRKKWLQLPRVQYTFRRWHAFALLAVIATGIIVSFVMYQLHQQQLARERVEQEQAHQAAVEKLKVRQSCLADVAGKKKDQLGKVTYDQLYDGLCN